MDLRRGDCLEVMPRLPAASIDLVLADLPYGTTACKWDTVIPFGPLWAAYRRLLKPTGAVVLTASQPFTSALVMSNPGWFKYCLVWEKNRLTNFFNVKHQPGKAHEDIAVFSPAAASYSPRGSMTYRPQMEPGSPWSKRDVGSGRHAYHAPKRPRVRISEGSRHPRSVLRFVCEFDYHPTQKPVALMEYLARTYTDPGATVLDNTMGSGTTGVACVLSGRRFIGIERDPGYFKVARRRIAEAQAALAPELRVAQ
jgi:site-specific DNA-methyltransferase (adenine-specific)